MYGDDHVRCRLNLRAVFDLGGDIGCPCEAEYASRVFVAHAAELFDTVFVVLGNQEGYGYASWADACAAAHAVCSQHGNIVLLDRSSHIVTSTAAAAVRSVSSGRRCGATYWGTAHAPSRAGARPRESGSTSVDITSGRAAARVGIDGC
jgi:hypothetical protein